LVLIVFAVLLIFSHELNISSYRVRRKSRDMKRKYPILMTVEIALCFFSFFLNFFWEVVQTYFYTLKDSSFSEMLYGWLHCTLGDVMLTVGSFWLVSAASRDRKWFLNLNRLNFIGFIMVGVVYTVSSEWTNVHMFKSWGYNELMPIIPWVQMGLTPFLQWIVIPPIVILLVRHHLLSDQETTKEREKLK